MKEKLMRFISILMFCLCAIHILFAQSEPVPFWYSDRNQLKDGNNYTYAVGVGYGNNSNDAQKEALDMALKQAEAYLRGLNIPQSDIDSLMLKIRMNESSNASWKIICLKEFKINNDDTRHKVYILYRFKKDIYKEFGDNDATIDCDLNFDIKRAEYYGYLNNSSGVNNNRISNEQKTTPQTPITDDVETFASVDNNSTLTIGKKYKLTIGSEVFSDFKIIIPQKGNLTLTLESFAQCTFFALFNEDGASLNPIMKEIIAGEDHNGYCPVPNYSRGLGDNGARFSQNDKVMLCYWSTSVKKSKGNYTFNLNAGTYYLLFLCRSPGTRMGSTDKSTANLSIQFKAMR